VEEEGPWPCPGPCSASGTEAGADGEEEHRDDDAEAVLACELGAAGSKTGKRARTDVSVCTHLPDCFTNRLDSRLSSISPMMRPLLSFRCASILRPRRVRAASRQGKRG
jgi:hypothetical protein